MDHTFVITGTTLTIHLPSEVDHHSSEQIRKEADRLIQSRNIRCILFDFEQTAFMEKVLRLKEDIVIVIDVEKVLSEDERKELNQLVEESK